MAHEENRRLLLAPFHLFAEEVSFAVSCTIPFFLKGVLVLRSLHKFIHSLLSFSYSQCGFSLLPTPHPTLPALSLFPPTPHRCGISRKPQVAFERAALC